MDDLLIPEACKRSNSSLEHRLLELKSKIEKKESQKTSNPQEKPSSKPSSQLPKTRPEVFQHSVSKLARSGRFTVERIPTGREYPTFLTRVPLFIPSKRGNQKELLDIENSIPFNTSWGQGRKFGPPLTTYDEDTLIAIGRLRQHRISGHSHKFPLPINSVFQKMNHDSTSVHTVCCLLTDIQTECGTLTGGKTNQLRLDSIKRLAATVVELTSSSKEKYVNYGTSIKLIDVAWEEYEKNSLLYIQFTPLMSLWYENEYTYIDFNVRKQLTDAGKAIHRFLSSQPKSYEIHTSKLLETILYQRPYKKFMADLRQTLKTLEELDWLKTYEISGSGRNNPHKLIIKR